eukprot:CAMPEP_0194040642 /NCGR_PEP_ID=MMETSP0009_2-20130614/12604_1 /TAXON_ID=210454 /ORGANISM="Grammatophora oceanica, Strain CCMP 410" /LENGTH=230 /DNA_ID=CAMNT_0038683835 /DNA_START=108 /DNA_END=800 /DNA_ORIENTATION=+
MENKDPTNTKKRKIENHQDARMTDRKPPPVILDPLLCSLLPKSLVENYIMPFITHVFTSKQKLKEAVHDYVDDPSKFCYPIRYWDVSRLTDFSYVFDAHQNPRLKKFNEDLTEWDVSNGRRFRFMFCNCHAFNGDVSSWNVSNAQELSGMFYQCTSFHGDVSSWNVANATSLCDMFRGCTSFNGDVSSWNVAWNTQLDSMFHGCDAFIRGEEGVRTWNLSDDRLSMLFAS